ncbi:MAG: helix-hairpin-helix domain-containing protein [Chloroflexota bacterium]|jgi:competence ComEA-like helix-hairpin-helix protein|nr:helix-hairpin-helix domain-containing protein [Chloroflexota bacterium]
MAVNKDSRININTASKDVLITISGIGEKLAKEIIEHRPFSEVEDLTNVSGISETKLTTILPYVTVSTAPATKARPKNPKPRASSAEKAPAVKFGDTEAFIFLEDTNERKDAALIILGGFILGLIIILLRRRKN